MAIQSIFQAGNSSVVAIPQELLKKTNMKIGEKVTVELLPDSEDIVIRREKKKKSSSGLTKEFHDWLEKTVEEDKEILLDLAKR